MKPIIALFTFFIFALSQEKVDVSGTVHSSDDDAPIVGASVLVSNTFIGASTDGEGRFFIRNVPVKKTILKISAVGYRSEQITFDSAHHSPIFVRLTPSIVQTQTVVITANKRSQSLEEIPVSMSIIGSKTFEQRNITALDDALRYVPGVNFQQSQINIRASSGYSRGVGSRVMLLIDGIPLLSGDTGEITFESIPVFQIDRVEIVKGAGSTLYGSGALGGVVNVLTKEAEQKSTVFWRLFSGFYSPPSFDQWKWSDKMRLTNGQYAGFSSRFGDLGVVLSVTRTSTDGYRESDWSRRYNGYMKLSYDISPFQSITFSSNFFHQHRAEFLWWKDFQNALLPADAQRNIHVTSLRFNNTINYKYVAGDLWYVNVKALHFRGNWFRDGINDVRLDRSISDAVVLDIQVNGTPLENNVITLGTTGNYERVRADIFGSHEGRGGAVYVQDEYSFSPDLSVTLGMRHDFHEVIGSVKDQQTNPKLGIRYSFDHDHTLKLSIGRGFRTPSISELFTTTSNTGSSVIVVPSGNLKSEHSWTYEISSSHFVNEHVQIDLAAFQTDLYDLIEPNVFLDSVPKINFVNITRARIQGIEVAVKTLLFNHSLSIDFDYNYNWAIDRDTKNFLRFRPRHIAGIHASYEYSSIAIGSDFRFISRIEQIDEKLVDLAPIKNGSQRVPAYIVDSRLIVNAAEFGLPFRISLNVNNIFDYHYAELIGNISPPRYFVLAFEGIIQ